MAKKTVMYNIDTAARRVTADIAGHGVVSVSLDAMSEANRAYAVYFGIQSRLSNAAAIERNSDGRILTPEEMVAERFARMSAIAAHLNGGAEEWDLPRSAGGGGDQSGLVIEAIARNYGWSVESTEAKITALAEKKGQSRREVLATYANIPDVARVMGDIRAERAAKRGLDAVALADELANA